MKALRVIAVVLLVAGILGLVYGGFTYTRESHETRLGPLQITVKDRETVALPLWLGVASTVVGAALLIVPLKGRLLS